MALGTDHVDSTALDVLIPEIWGEMTNNFFRQELTFASFFTDRSDELSGGGDTVYTPNIAEMSASTKTSEAEVTLNANTEDKQDLVVNTWKEVSFLIEDREAAQVKQSYTIQLEYMQNAAYTAANQLENAISALFSDFSNTVGASSTNLADSEIRSAIATMETNNVPGMKQDGTGGSVAFFLHPNTFWNQVQGIDKFSLAQNSPVNDPTAKRPSGFLYGIPVFVSSNVPYESGTSGRLNVIAHRDAIHWARQSLPTTGASTMVGSEGIRVQTNYIPEYLGYLTTADVCYGVIENRDEAAVLLKSHATAA